MGESKMNTAIRKFDSVIKIIFSGFLLLVSVAAVNAATASSAVSQCDLSAAHPDDPQKVAEGVAWDNINLDSALTSCELAINEQPGNARIQYQYARVLDKNKSYEKAFEYYEKAAKQGYTIAQNSLGLAYEWGQGVKGNNQQALYWYSKAAKKGYAQAQNNLGTMYDIGKAGSEDEKQALHWFRKAAQQGDATAQRNLGTMYSRGSGVRQNDELAFEWYLKAANQNQASAQYYVGVSYYYGKGVSMDPDQARAWFEKAASNGNYEAGQVMHKIQFKQTYCESLKSKAGINAGYEKLTSEKFLGKRECDG